MGRDVQGEVGKRRVFYIPGFDPIHPRRYRELFRKEGAAQSKISGYKLTLKPRKSGENFGWSVDAEIDGQTVRSDFEVLNWYDIVQKSMGHGIAGTFMRMIQTAWIYVRSGALWRLMRLRKGPVIAALYPVVMLLFQAFLALCALMLSIRVGRELDPETGTGGGALGAIVGIGLAWAILEFFRRWDRKFFVYYLMHDYAYNARLGGEIAPELDRRISSFTDAIADALNTDVDEVLVVGHSSGAHLGVVAMADLIRAGRVPKHGPKLGFLTLGQVVPMVSFLPRAWRFRRELAYLSEREEFFWVDVTAPGDGCAFALCDPVAVSGVAGPGKKWPLVFSAAFTKTLSPARWKELRWRFFQLHFQYLCAFDRPGDYDYFQITAGPVTLAQRYRERRPSKSRIETPVNTMTSTAP